VQNASTQRLRERAREILEHNATTGVRAPRFGADKEWLNVERSLDSAHDLAGKVVLLDFWTYCCINCQHVLVDLKALERKYADRPFVVVGVHAAKFANERDVESIRQAVLRESIDHPVVVDRDFDIWSQFTVRAWPTLVLLSPDGRILGQVSGEGQLAVLDALIEAALDLYGERGMLDARALPLRLERNHASPRELRFPGKLLASAELDRLWIADSGHHRVVECDLDGRFVRVFGSGRAGLRDGSATIAEFHGPQGLTLHEGALIVADTLNHALRRIDLESGETTTLAGDGEQGYERVEELDAADARLNSPWDVLSLGGELAIAMAGSHQLWSYEFESETLRPLAGDGGEARLDGFADDARFAQPSGLARHGDRLLVADSESSSIRVLELDSRSVSTIAGGSIEPGDLFHFGDEDGEGPGRRFQHPLGVAIEPGADDEHALAYVADTYNHRIKLLDPDSGTASAYAGTGQRGAADGECESASFCEPGGLSLAGDRLFVADTNNHSVRVIDLIAHEVRTLDTSSVPLPAAPRGAPKLDVSELPRLPTTVDHGARKLRMPSSGGALRIDLALSADESLAADSPSQYRALRVDGLAAARNVAGPIEGPQTRIELGVAGNGELRVQALFYVCDADGRCTLRSHEWRFDIEHDDKAPAREVELRCDAQG